MSQVQVAQRAPTRRSTPDGALAVFPAGTRRVEHLAELVLLVRERFALEDRMSAEDVLAALRTIAAYSDTRSRWLAAFASPLGAALVGQGVDLSTALGFIIHQLPRADA